MSFSEVRDNEAFNLFFIVLFALCLTAYGLQSFKIRIPTKGRVVRMTNVTVTKTFGHKHIASSYTSTYFARDIKKVCKFTLSDDASISKITVWGKAASGTIPVKGLIYSDNNGAPDTLIGATVETTVDANYGLKHLSFAAPVELAAGTYWIGLFHDGDVNFWTRYTSGDTNQTATATDDYTDGPSESFGTPTYGNTVFPFFATYTTTVTMTAPPAIVGKTVTTVATNKWAIRWQEKSFAAVGRIWVFYQSDEYVASYYKAYFTSSADEGETWETPTYFGDNNEKYGERLQAILETKNGNSYVHVFIGDVYYRRGLLNSDGTITWTADWDHFWSPPPAPSYNTDAYAVLDSNGYPWVIWCYGSSLSDMEVWVSKSSRNDGIWETETGYPVKISENETGRYLTNSFIVALSNGKLYAFYFSARGDGGSANSKIYGKMWNGSAWGSEETCTTSGIVQQYATGSESWSRGVAVDSDDNIHLVFLDDGASGAANIPAFSWSVRYVKRTWGTGWGTEQVVATDNLYKSASPGMALYGDEIRVFWTGEPSPNIIHMAILDTEGWWSGAIYLVDETTDIIPNSDTYGYDGIINPFPKMYEDKLGFIWITKTNGATPYKIKFGFEEYKEYFRVYKKEYSKSETSEFDKILKRFKTVKGAPSMNVTLRTLTLGDRDSVTGWYDKDYSDSTIEMLIIPRGSYQNLFGIGYYVSLDALGFTTADVNVYDQIVDAADRYWEIKSVEPVVIGDVLKCWKCDLKEIFVL